MRGLVGAGAALVLVSGVMAQGAGAQDLGVQVETAVPVAPFDFDGDGFADLAVGIPGENLPGGVNAGAVQVLYGSASGVTARDQFWHQGRKGVKGAVERGDRFGSSLASADFDSDGFADLAIGIPFEKLGTVNRAGAVQVLYGSPTGLTARDQVWHRGKPGVPGEIVALDDFGWGLAEGDFDGDGYADLVIQGVRQGPAVVLRGSDAGLTGVGAMALEQVAGETVEDLAAGDVNGDDLTDVVVKVSREGADGAYGGDAIRVLLSGSAGLGAVGSQYVELPTLGLPPGAIGGLSLADLNADGSDDLAMVLINAVKVAVLHGHDDGFHPAELPTASTPGTDSLWTVPAGWDYAGWGDLAGGDFSGDGYVDLAVEVRGYVAVIRGTSQGLGSAMTQWPVVGNNSDLRVLPLSGPSRPWLVIGRRSAKVGGIYPGSVTVVRGTLAGDPGKATTWHQNTRGIKDRAESGDGFGSAVA